MHSSLGFSTNARYKLHALHKMLSSASALHSLPLCCLHVARDNLHNSCSYVVCRPITVILHFALRNCTFYSQPPLHSIHIATADPTTWQNCRVSSTSVVWNPSPPQWLAITDPTPSPQCFTVFSAVFLGTIFRKAVHRCCGNDQTRQASKTTWPHWQKCSHLDLSCHQHR